MTFAAGAQRGVKRAIERLLGSRLAAALSAPRRSGKCLVLAYHNIVEEDEPPASGDRSLHLPLRRFCEQLDCLRECELDVVSLEGAAAGQNGSPTIAITFDDAYAGALQLGTVELARRGLPATMFVAPGLLGLDAPWWDRLAEPATGVIPPATRRIALQNLGGWNAPILAAAAEAGWPIHAAEAAFRIASAEQVDLALRAHQDLTLGSHSWGHPNLTCLSGQDLQDELTQPIRWLRDRWPGRSIPWLAYPYGLESQGVRLAASTAGYRGGLLVTGGWSRDEGNPFAFPRLNVSSGLSLNGFRARLAGFLIQ